MILLFPDAATLKLVVGTDGLVPAEAILGPATVSEAGGKLAVEFDGKLPRKPAGDLTALGVTTARRHVGEARPVSCWPEILPAERLPRLPELSAAAPVLFDLPAGELAAFAGEMLRLGNDRQQILGLDGGRVLLRVVGPPYYTLLRAVDDPAGRVAAFAEAAPKVWMQLGFAHPLGGLLKPAAGQMLLIGPGRWEAVPDGPFRDLYEVLRFDLPADPEVLTAVADDSKLTVPLTLAAGGGTDAAELWVLRGEAAADTLDQFVREADNRLVQRLKFAVADAPAGRVIAVRTTAGRQAPPVLALPGAVGFRPFSKLPNLYLPVGRRLHPALRRDAVRELLADDPDRLVWLYPDGDRSFIPESLPEGSFRPLADWVEYVIGEHARPLSEWVEASTFAFEPFACGESERPKPGRPPTDDGPRARKSAGKPTAQRTAAESPPDSPRPEAMTAAPLVPAAPTPVAEWRQRREALERQFLAIDGAIDDPARRTLWPDLAVANAGAEEPGEAANCWLNAAWTAVSPAAVAGQWLATEFPAGPPADAAGFDALLAESPTPSEARRAVALILATAHRTPSPAWFTERLPAAQRFLTANEGKLPVRAVWLTAVRLAELGGSDALGLARVRDRLLARMLDEGLNPERDLPAFLRFAGLADSDRVRQARAGVGALHAAVTAWCRASLSAKKDLIAAQETRATPAYVDFLFAFGLARLGDTSGAAQLADAARKALDALPPEPAVRVLCGRWAADGFGFRVGQAAAGRSHAGPLPAPLLATLEQWHKAPQAVPKQAMSVENTAAASLEALRHGSRVLDPVEKLHPYRDMMSRGESFKHLEEVRRLEHLGDPTVFARRVRELYDGGLTGRPTPADRLSVLGAALPLAHRGGEGFAVDLLSRLLEHLASAGPTDKDTSERYALLLERGLYLAGFYDRRDVVAKLVEQFLGLLRGRPDDQRFEMTNGVVVQGLRSLRRLGLREEIDRLVGRLPEAVFGTQPVAGVVARHVGKPPALGLAVPAALAVAAGWQAVGLADRAAPVLAEVEALLTGPQADKLPVKDYPAAVVAYLAAVGFGPADAGLERMRRLFEAMADPRLGALVVNRKTSAPAFSLFHLAIAEEAVTAVTGDDYTLAAGGRRWLEEDEQVVRRRLHQDTRRVLDRGL